MLLTIVFCGDNRLHQLLRSPELVPLGTRIRTRLHLEANTKKEIIGLLKESCKRAGAEELMIAELMETLAEHAAGNPRIVMILAIEVLPLTCKKELRSLSAPLYLEAFPQSPPPGSRKSRS